MGYERKRGRGAQRSPPPDPYAYGNYGSGEYRGRRNGEDKTPPRPPLKDIKPESVLGRVHELLNVLDSFLACRPRGNAQHSRIILVALYPLLRESFELYADIAEILAILLDGFFDMDYHDCVKSFEAYARAAKHIDELCVFYGWCKDAGVARSSEYPEVERITDKLLELLEEFTRNRATRTKSPPREAITAAPTETRDEEPEEAMNSIKALPAPPDHEEEAPEPAKEVAAEPVEQQQQQGDLVDLRDDSASAADNLELALFEAPVAAGGSNGSWVAFPSSDGETGVTSAWQNPAAERGNADWEMTLVETASNLSKQKATLAGGFDPLLLNGMYDQGAVRQHANAQASGGSASSVALPGPGRGGAAPVLALPAPDGTVKTFGQDPFAASLGIPPPPFVQMADAEKKRQLLVQEQVMWQQYAKDGMQGQAGLANRPNTNFMPTPALPYGMPSAYNNTAGGYYYPTY
ncbi:ENTH [Musa troglodytarum]|uniref:ENTH n=1 Tax=Musa troglodytarum TaxID=320322 RepID=A0A9E7ER07_9LILI|nr:ENTH [Musa troglodytarum]